MYPKGWEHLMQGSNATSRTNAKPVVYIVSFIAIMMLASTIQASSRHEARFLQPIEDLKITIVTLMEEYSIPGAAIAIVSRDTVIFLGGFGFADLEHRTPVSENTCFRMGSVTKHFLAEGFLTLVEDGLIELNMPIMEIVPEIEVKNPWRDSDPVRVVHLLEHTSGFSNSFREFNIDDDPGIQLYDALQIVGGALQCRFRPGTCFSYSNTGYGAAGYILEKAAGERYEDYLERTILVPIGMIASTFKIKDFQNCGSLARGYVGNYEIAPYVNFYSRSSGIMLSTAADMAKYVQFLLNRGEVGGNQIIGDSLITRMETPSSSVASQNGLPLGYGLGLEQSYRNGYKWLGHNGAHFGFYSDFWYNRELNIGFVALLNRFDMSAPMHVIRDAITDYLLPDREPDSLPACNIARTQLESYTGHYQRKNNLGELLGWIDLILGDATVSTAEGRLYFQHYLENTSLLIPVTAGLFREPDMPDANTVFFTTQEGSRALVHQNSYYEKTEAWKPWLARWSFFAAVSAMLSSILYALFWIPVSVYKRIAKRDNRPGYLRVRVFPLISVVSLLYGFILFTIQDPTHIAKLNFVNIQFTVSTLIFAVFSFVSLVIALVSFKRKIRRIASIYALIVSLSCVGMTVFLGYWGIIGLRLYVN